MFSISHTLRHTCITAYVFQFYSKNTDTHIDQTETAQNLEMKIVHSKKRNCVYDKGIKKNSGDFKHTKLGSLRKNFFFFLVLKGKAVVSRWVWSDLVRQQHNETKTQDLTHFQSHEMTMLSIHFCPLLCVCVRAGGTRYSMLEKLFFQE